MGEINTTAGDNRHGGAVRKSKKLSTRVDLTPMVDLGFLLITFFIFSTTLSEPKAMNFHFPADGPPITTGESATLSVIACNNNRVFYYHGRLDDAFQKGNYGFTSYHVKDGVGNTIRDKRYQMELFKKGFSKDLMFIIHPTTESNYQNIVNLLDEVLINDLHHYVLVDLKKEDKSLLQKYSIGL